jgi:hypothetical protein
MLLHERVSCVRYRMGEAGLLGVQSEMPSIELAELRKDELGPVNGVRPTRIIRKVFIQGHLRKKLN